MLNKWKESFQCFLVALGATTEAFKKTLLLHLIEIETETKLETLEIFDTFKNNRETVAEPLTAFYDNFSVKKNKAFKIPKFHQAKQEAN